MTDDIQAARVAALRLLARREHTALELRQKLARRDHPGEAIDAALSSLAAESLLSDARFAVAYIEGRANRGVGPLRLLAELRKRGVDAALIEDTLDFSDVGWRHRAAVARAKRFGAALPQDMKARARQARFLQYRGFSAEQTRAALDAGPDEFVCEDNDAY